MNGSAVWVTRPEPGNRITSQILKGAGCTVVSAPLLEVTYPDTVHLPSFSPPDWIIFVSGHAVQGLEQVLGSQEIPIAVRERVQVAAVGQQTASRARDLGWQVDIVPDVETAASLMDALSAFDFSGGSVWIPGGNQRGSARESLPDFIDARGGEPHLIPVYEVHPRRLSPEERDLLATAVPGAVLLHSPSSAEELLGSKAIPKPWLTAPVISIGPATSARCRELGVMPAVTCESPSDEAVIKAVSSLRTFPERNLS